MSGTPWKKEIRSLVELAVPVVLVQAGMQAMNLVDTVMVGHLDPAPGENPLTAVGLGSFYTWTSLIFSFGVILALDPVISQAVGARDEGAITRGVQRGLILAVLLTIPSGLIALGVEPMLRATDQDPGVIPDAVRYTHINIIGMLPVLVFGVFRQTLQAMGHLRAIVLVILLANGANVVLNWMLVYGNLGFPAMRVEGSAWATVTSRWLMAGGIVAATFGVLGPHLLAWQRRSFALRPLGRMLRLGAPIGGQFQLEFGAFGAALLLMGWIGPAEQEGHQIAINLASFSFMVPLGIAAAATVRVGHAVGREDHPGVRRAGIVALFAGGTVMLGFGASFLLIPFTLARLFTDRADIVGLATVLIPIAGVFQVFDGLQAVAAGVLRGLGATRMPLLLNLLGFWVIGLPVSWVLAFPAGLGPAGIWWGLVLGLLTVSLLLVWRVLALLQRETRRVVIDDPITP